MQCVLPLLFVGFPQIPFHLLVSTNVNNMSQAQTAEAFFISVEPPRESGTVYRESAAAKYIVVSYRSNLTPSCYLLQQINI